MRITQEDVLKAVRELGPVVANKIKQRLNQPDSMMVNIYLSDLAREGKVRMTHVQLGSSSFAYTPEHIPKLEALIDNHNEKDRRVAHRLKQEKVMRASEQDPLTRVALQNIKDFAKPVQVKTSQGEETFYRWYMLSAEQAQTHIRELLGVAEPKTPVVEEAVTPPQEAPARPVEQRIAPEPVTPQQQEPVKKAVDKPKEQQQPLTKIEAESDFAKQLLAYFKEKRIVASKFEEVRKNSEIDAIIQLPTSVGNIKYYCKAKSKKSSNDGDLAAAILTAKSKMLPALYITTGTVTKKAKENKELQEIMVVELGNSN